MKGHQDDHESELPLEAQLNVRADALAGDYIHTHISPQPTVPVTDICPCHLQIGSTTITSHYRQAIQDAASAPQLRQYILTFCKSPAHSSMINWNLFSTTNQWISHLRVWSTKFLFNLLPAVKYDKTYTYQEHLGWGNFIKGLWHKDWCLAQDTHLKETHQYNVRSTGTLWALKVIAYLRKMIHSRWVEYTHSVHNPDNAMTATCKRLLDRITYLQSQYEQHCPHLSHQFFLDPTKTHYTPTTLQNWLNIHAPVVEQAIKIQRQHALLSQTLITTYFT